MWCYVLVCVSVCLCRVCEREGEEGEGERERRVFHGYVHACMFTVFETMYCMCMFM